MNVWVRGNTERILHISAEIRNFSFDKKYILRSAANECNVFRHEKRNYVSPSSHIRSIYDVNTHYSKNQIIWLEYFLQRKARCNFLRNHSNGDLFMCYYFHMWRYYVFARDLIWYFIVLYIKKIFYHNYINPKFISSPLRCLVMHFGFGCDFGCGLSRTPRESYETNASKQSFLSQRKSTPKF